MIEPSTGPDVDIKVFSPWGTPAVGSTAEQAAADTELATLLTPLVDHILGLVTSRVAAWEAALCGLAFLDARRVERALWVSGRTGMYPLLEAGLGLGFPADLIDPVRELRAERQQVGGWNLLWIRVHAPKPVLSPTSVGPMVQARGQQISDPVAVLGLREAAAPNLVEPFPG